MVDFSWYFLCNLAWRNSGHSRFFWRFFSMGFCEALLPARDRWPRRGTDLCEFDEHRKVAKPGDQRVSADSCPVLTFASGASIEKVGAASFTSAWPLTYRAYAMCESVLCANPRRGPDHGRAKPERGLPRDRRSGAVTRAEHKLVEGFVSCSWVLGFRWIV